MITIIYFKIDWSNNMSKQNKPLLTDDFLDEVAKEISELYGGPTAEQNDLPDESKKNEMKNEFNE